MIPGKKKAPMVTWTLECPARRGKEGRFLDICRMIVSSLRQFEKYQAIAMA
jgi:hypothetical protein